ncbi:MAG: YitT family protein [Oscillospiraceae bacterium]|nr:YitT family protein [Oscillospiraceae bacterium]
MIKRVAAQTFDYTVILFGNLLFAVAVIYFILPHQIPLGGLSGIALILYVQLGWPIGSMVLLMNLPLFFIGFRSMGVKFLVRTIFSVAAGSFLLDFLPHILPYFHIEEILMAALCGGILAGLGFGLVLSRGATGGGIDIIGKLVQRKRGDLSLGRIALYINVVIFIAAAFLFHSPEAILYALVVQFISGMVLDSYLNGLDSATSILIVTSQPEQVRDVLLAQVKRGATAIDAKGMFSGDNKTVFLCAVRRYEITAVKKAVTAADAEAFLILANVQEVLGKGFKPFAAY